MSSTPIKDDDDAAAAKSNIKCEFCESGFKTIADFKRHIADKHHDKLNW
jgi:hypothetical protein